MHTARTSQRPPPTTFAQKVALVSLGLLAALAALELALRVAGRFLLWRESRRNEPAGDATAKARVLCIGESTTAMGGHPAAFGGAADSYPRILEELLARRFGPGVVRVVNAARPAIGTEEIRAELPLSLARHRPDVVVAMLGVNDPDAAFDRTGERSALARALGDIRVVRAFAYFARAMPSRAPPGAAEVLREQERILRREASGADPSGAARLALATFLLARAAVDEADALMAELRLDDRRAVALELGRWCLARVRGGERAGRDVVLPAIEGVGARGVRALAEAYCALMDGGRGPVTALLVAGGARAEGPEGITAALGLAVASAMDALAAAGAGNEAARLGAAFAWTLAGHRGAELEGKLARSALAAGRFDDFEAHLAAAERIRRASPKPVTVRNYRAIARLLERRGIPLVAVQYPLRELRTLHELLGPSPGVVFVDNREAFTSALRTMPYEALFFDAFAGDFGHATARGNRLLAGNVARAVIPLVEKRLRFLGAGRAGGG